MNTKYNQDVPNNEVLSNPLSECSYTTINIERNICGDDDEIKQLLAQPAVKKSPDSERRRKKKDAR